MKEMKKSVEIRTADALTKDLKEEFLQAFKRGIDAFQTAGDALAKLVDADPDAIEKIQSEHGIPSSILRQFLSIGRGKLLPQLFTAPAYVKQLPVADQKKLVEGQVEALVMRSDGGVDTIKVDVMSPDSKMVRQVIGPRGIRTLSEQRAALVADANAVAARKEALNGKAEKMPYRVVGKKILIGSNEFTAADLLNMLKLIS